jgi:mono/diheme cytochrome c family protein
MTKACWIIGVFLVFVGCSDEDLGEVLPIGPLGGASEENLGLRLVPAGIELDLSELSAAEEDLVKRGSYLVNGIGGCVGCHSSDAGYMAGGNEFRLSFLPADAGGNTSVLARNLTPDPDTGMQLDADEFIEAMRTGLDVHDSEGGTPQRLMFMAIQAYRFIKEDDLRAIYSYLRRIPPVHNELRIEYGSPLPPVPAPPLIESGDPQGVERGLEIPALLSLLPEGADFAADFAAATADLSAERRDQVGRGSYLLNALANCGNCHTDGVEDGNFDSGLLPGSLNTNLASYLAGGVNIGVFSRFSFPVFSRNLTPHSEHGLKKTEEEFIQIMQWGVDFRRPGGSLRVGPHFPVDYRMTESDLKAIYAYLSYIPAVDKPIEIVESGGSQ